MGAANSRGSTNVALCPALLQVHKSFTTQLCTNIFFHFSLVLYTLVLAELTMLSNLDL